MEEAIEKSLKDRDRQNKRKNTIIFVLPESKKNEPEERQEEDVKRIVGLIKNIYKINFSQDLIDRAINHWKATKDKERPLLIALKEETKKCEIFQNLNKMRDAGA